jgi:hypothetical protein
MKFSCPWFRAILCLCGSISCHDIWRRDPDLWNGIDGWMLETYHDAVMVTYSMNKVDGRHDGSLFTAMREDLSDLSGAFEKFNFPVFVMNLKKRPEKRRKVFSYPNISVKTSFSLFYTQSIDCIHPKR